MARATPDDHFTTGPHRRVKEASVGRVSGAGGCPIVRAGIVSPAAIQVRETGPYATPHDHLTAGPDRGVKLSGSRHVDVGGCPTVRARIVSAATVQKVVVIGSTPDYHLMACPHCRVKTPRSRRVGASSCPSIRAGIVSTASVQVNWAITTPDDHLAASPYRGVIDRPPGAAVVVIAVQSSGWDCIVLRVAPSPPQTIISVPVHTAV